MTASTGIPQSPVLPGEGRRRFIVKYAAFARLGFREARAEPGELLGRVLFFAMILGVFSAVWRAVEESSPGTRDPREMLWYIAMTEWVVMSVPMIHFQMAEDIRRGDVAYQMARPASWLGSRIAHGLGTLALRAPVMLAVACGAASVFAGVPANPGRLVVAVAFGLAAAVVMTVFQVGIGVFAFWLGDVMPAWWIWQKLMFVIGGMLLPLQFYPRLFVRFAMLTPFPAFLAGPASFMTAAPLMTVEKLAVSLAFWAMIGLLAARVTFGKAVRRLQFNGG
jgi:ABC-2 type transport system permease protein